MLEFGDDMICRCMATKVLKGGTRVSQERLDFGTMTRKSYTHKLCPARGSWPF
jgi:hypothetical protein